MQRSSIEWTDLTSNPIRVVGGGWGCTRVSTGCRFCYADVLNKRFGNGRSYSERHWKFELLESELDKWKRRRKPAKVFVGDMLDIFHEDVPDKMLGQLFLAMQECPSLTFQVLTKRAHRMANYLNWVIEPVTTMSNIWFGVSAENQYYYRERWEAVKDIPAAIRWVSYEPALGPVNIKACLPGPDWIVAGGESGSVSQPAGPYCVRRLPPRAGGRGWGARQIRPHSGRGRWPGHGASCGG